MNLNSENLHDISYETFTDLDLWAYAINQSCKSLQIIHINVCSLRKYFNQLLVLLQPCIDAIDIIILTEINITEEYVSIYNIPNFTKHAYTRTNKRGGGIMVYIRDHIKYEANNVNCTAFEGVYIKFSIDNYDAQLIAVYRPPHKNKNLFIEQLDCLLKGLPRKNNTILAGDCNIDLLDQDSVSTTMYLNVLSKHGLQCGIRGVTREAIVSGRHVQSCIDHLFVRNAVADDLSAYTLTTQLADHYLTGLTIGIHIQEEPIKCTKVILCQNIIRNKLDNIDWSGLMNIDCPLVIYKEMCNIFNDIYKASKIEINVESHRITQPWIDKSLLNLIEAKDTLFRKWKSQPRNMRLRLEYTKARNKLNKMVNIARNMFKQEEIKSCKGDIRKIWQNINKWLGRNKTSIDKVIIKYMCLNNNVQNVCNQFCDTFTHEIETIKHKCSQVFLERAEYVTDSNVTFLYNKIDAGCVIKIIDRLDSNKSPGSDGIRIKDLKYIKEKISPIIAKFINLCILSGKYPEELKVSLIRPIYKQGSHTEYTNYRPIAILNSINKITEKVVVEQITNFLEKNSILSNKQHGFRRNRSTATALEQFTDDVNNYLNDKKQVVALFIDFKKAFDTLDHGGLLRAMNECGIRGYVQEWFQEYLNDRHMRVVIDMKTSDRGNIQYGVPTGSVYGPIGYIMHVNSITNVIKHCNSYMYADDTCLLYAGKDEKIIENCIQEDFDSVVKWAHDNGIILNLNKTKIIRLYSPYNKHNICNDVHITGHSYDCLHANNYNCQCNVLEEVTKIKYLGLTIDNTFSWKLHINNINNKLRTILGKLYQLTSIVSRGTLYSVYYALVDAVIGYGLSCYGLTFKTYLQKIKNLQIRILKMIIDKKTKDSLNKDYEKLFKICQILPVDIKVNYLILLQQLQNDQFKVQNIFKYPTRKAAKPRLAVPHKCNNYYGQRTRKWIVPRLFNDLPEDFEQKYKTKCRFKLALKKLLLSII